MADERAYETMMDVFRRANPDGSYFFTDADVRHFLPWMMMNTAIDLDALDDGSLQLFADACLAAGVVAGMPAQDARAKFAAYYAAHPVHPELVSGFKAAVREVVGGAAAQGATFAKFAGTANAKMGAPPAVERPAGTVAGPLARFADVPGKK